MSYRWVRFPVGNRLCKIELNHKSFIFIEFSNGQAVARPVAQVKDCRGPTGRCSDVVMEGRGCGSTLNDLFDVRSDGVITNVELNGVRG